MKLLICTQAVDRNHPILGFFHRWIEEFAKHCEEVHVICLQKGEYSLPANVHVHSLGKEEGNPKLVQLFNFYRHIWRLRNRYDNVFVHMNQIYVLLGALHWKIFRKKIGLWYMHKSVTLSLRIAEKLTDSIFTGSKESFRIPSKKLIVTGHGIDTEHFAPQIVPKDIDLITVGRIARSKNLHTLIDVFSKIRQTLDISLTIAGDTMTKQEESYLRELQKQAADANLSGKINFIGAIPQAELPKLLNRSKVFVHTAQNGSLDKATLEALSCRLPVVTMAPGAASLPLRSWHVSSEADFQEQVIEVLQSDVQTRTQMLREHVQVQHGITALIPKILKNYH